MNQDIQRTQEHAQALAKLLFDQQAIQPTLLYVGDSCSFTDFFLIVTYQVPRHGEALVRMSEEFLASYGYTLNNHPHISDETVWILADFGDITLHVFESAAREFYDLESLWKDLGKIIPLSLDHVPSR